MPLADSGSAGHHFTKLAFHPPPTTPFQLLRNHPVSAGMRALIQAMAATLALAIAPQQIHIHYTTSAGVLSVDFVATDAPGNASLSLSENGPWTTVQSTYFNMPQVGFMHQAVLPFNVTSPGVAAFYKVATESGQSVRSLGGGAAVAGARWQIDRGSSLTAAFVIFPPLPFPPSFHSLRIGCVFRLPDARARCLRGLRRFWRFWPPKRQVHGRPRRRGGEGLF